MPITDVEFALMLKRNPQLHEVDAQGRTPATPAQSMDINGEPEKTFMAEIIKLAKHHGYEAYHTHNSRKSDPGFPDLVLCRPASTTSPGRLIFAELKSSTGKLTTDQHRWLSVLEHSLPDVEVYCWHPEDWRQLIEILTR